MKHFYTFHGQIKSLTFALFLFAAFTASVLPGTVNAQFAELATGIGDVTSIKGGGGSYSIDFSAYNPDLYQRAKPGEVRTPAGLDNSPFGFTGHDLTVESLNPRDIGVGQIVAFEFFIQVNSDGACHDDAIEFVPRFATQTTGKDPFGFDPEYGIYAAFVDINPGGGLIDPDGDARVGNFLTVRFATYFEGNIKVEGLDPGDVIPVEVWVVLQDELPSEADGNVASALTHAYTAGNGIENCAPGDVINTGTQTVPLKVDEFYSTQTDVSVISQDAEPVELCGMYTYNIMVYNSGPSVANGVVLTVANDVNSDFVSYSENDITGADWLLRNDTQSLVFSTDFLNPGESVIFTITASIPANAPFINTDDMLNSAVISTVTADANLDNNSTSNSADVLCPVPVITLPYEDLTMECYDEQIVNDWVGKASAFDNCGKLDIQTIFRPPTSGCFEETEVTFTASNICGNVANAVKSFTIIDTTGPQITVPDAECLDSSEIDSFILAATAVDGCSGQVDVQATTVKHTDDCGTVEIIFTASDNCGNVTTLNRTFYTNDTAGPVITLPAAEPDLECFNTSAIDTWASGATAFDACGGEVAVTVKYAPPSSVCNDTVAVTFSSIDNCGNITEITRKVAYRDTIPPVIAVPLSSLNIECYDVAKVEAWIAKASAADACSGTVPVSASYTPPSGLCYEMINVTFTAVDNCGNKAVATKAFTINDKKGPVITVPLVKCMDVSQIESWIASAKAVDACSGTEDVQYSYTPPSADCSLVTATFIAEDDCGNTTTLTRTFFTDDNISPDITLPPADLSMECFSAALVSQWVMTATAFDACSGKRVVGASYISPRDNCDEVVEVTFTAMDDCGNIAVAKKSFTVDNNTAPIITCPGDQIRSLPYGALGYTAAGQEFDPVIARKCTAVTAINNINNSNTLSGYIFAPGETTVIWTATDVCGNSSVCSFKVIVNSQIHPEIICPEMPVISECSPYVAGLAPEVVDPNGDIVSLTWTMTGATTAESDATGINYIPEPYLFEWGNTMVTYVITDNTGYSTACSFEVTVTPCSGNLNCTYTQGFYGSVSGKTCDGITTPQDLMEQAFNCGDLLYKDFGNISAGRYFRLYYSDVVSGNIYKMLPGGSEPAALTGYSTYSERNSWEKVPLQPAGPSEGKVMNNLLSQTIVLWFNMQNDPSLGGLYINDNYLITLESTSCESDIPLPGTEKLTEIPEGILSYFDGNGFTISQLFVLANDVLGGFNGISPSVVGQAVDALNNAFDQCRVFTGTSDENQLKSASGIPELELNVFPNPFKDVIQFELEMLTDTHVTIEIYNGNGVLTGIPLNEDLPGGETRHVSFDASMLRPATYIFRLTTKSGVLQGNIIKTK